MKTLFSSLVLSLSVAGVVECSAAPQTFEVGQQVLIANRTANVITIDGQFGPGEWSGAIPFHVDGNRPLEAPGVTPWFGLPGGLNPPSNPADSSYNIRALYDDQNLYVSVEVADDIVVYDSSAPFLDDDVEIFIDGDNQPWDFFADGLEGFQLVSSADPSSIPGVTAVLYPWDFFKPVDWTSQPGATPRGFVIEFRISLDSIDTADGDGFRRPEPGDAIGFNVTVADDDFGGNSYLDDPIGSGYLAWDGSSPNWFYAQESDWGTLVFAP